MDDDLADDPETDAESPSPTSERSSRKPFGPSWSVSMPSNATIAAMLAAQDRNLSAVERVVRDLRRLEVESPTMKAIRELQVGTLVPDGWPHSFTSALPKDWMGAGLIDAVNVAAAAAGAGIPAQALAAFQEGAAGTLAKTMANLPASVLATYNATPAISAATIAREARMSNMSQSLTALSAYAAAATPPNALASASQVVSVFAAGLPRIDARHMLSPGLSATMEAVRLASLQHNFGTLSGGAAGALGRLDAVIHEDTRLGSATDGLIAAPTRRGPVGFDYGTIQRRSRQVDDLLEESPARAEVSEAVDEAQDAAGLDDDVLLDFSQALGIPAARSGRGPSGASILFVAAYGSATIALDIAWGSFHPGQVADTLLTGVACWALLAGRKPN